MVKAGDKTLESYLYAPNNGPLITVAYGNGDTQEILYDKEERIRARRWNGESTDAVRYEYDDYGTLEKEIDLVNGRIDKDQYDMTGRLVQSATLEKIPGQQVSRPWQTLIQCSHLRLVMTIIIA